MSLRSAEEGLTALSYPAVAYQLDRGYGIVNYIVDGVNTLATTVGNTIVGVTGAQEATKQTKYTTKAQAEIAEQQARVAMANAKAEVEIQQQYVLMEAERTRQLPFKIAGTLAGLGVLAFVVDRISARRGQVQSQRQGQSQSQRQRAPQRQQQRSL